jgi:hypothetical protein
LVIIIHGGHHTPTGIREIPPRTANDEAGAEVDHRIRTERRLKSRPTASAPISGPQGPEVAAELMLTVEVTGQIGTVKSVAKQQVRVNIGQPTRSAKR